MSILTNKKNSLAPLLSFTLFCQSACADGGVMPVFSPAYSGLQAPYNASMLNPAVCYPPSPIMPTYESSFIDFAELTRVGEKSNGVNGGEHAGVYQSLGVDDTQETYYVKDPSFTGLLLNEYLASLFLQEFYPQGSAVVKLMKDLPGYVASKAIKGFVPFKNLNRSKLKDVSYQSSIDLCVARNILGLSHLHDGNAGIKINEDESVIEAGVDYEASFGVNQDFLLLCQNTVNTTSEKDLLSAYKSFVEKYPRDFFEQSFANIEAFLKKHLVDFNHDQFNYAKKKFFSKYQELQNIIFLDSNNITSTHLHKLDWLKPEHVTKNVVKHANIANLKFFHELGWLKPEHVTKDVLLYANIANLKFFHELGWLKPEHVTQDVVRYANIANLKFLHESSLLKPERMEEKYELFLKSERMIETVVKYANIANLKFLHELGWLKPEYVTEDVVRYANIANLKFLHELGWLKPEHVTEDVVVYANIANLKFLHESSLLKPEHVTQDVVRYANLERLSFFHEAGWLRPEHITDDVMVSVDNTRFLYSVGLISWYNPLVILDYLITLKG